MEKREKIIIDTDIGDDIDDAYALALAVRMKKFDILGVTTVFRNSMQRAKIASALLGALGEDPEVYAGEDYPYKAAFQVEDFEERLPDGRPVIPHYFPEFASAPVRSLSAVDFIAEQAEKAPGEVTLMAIGPLTNLAKTAEKYPNSFRKLSRIICMGGRKGGMEYPLRPGSRGARTEGGRADDFCRNRCDRLYVFGRIRGLCGRFGRGTGIRHSRKNARKMEGYTSRAQADDARCAYDRRSDGKVLYLRKTAHRHSARRGRKGPHAIYGFSVRDGSYLRDGLGQNGISPFFHKYLEIGGSDAYQIF